MRSFARLGLGRRPLGLFQLRLNHSTGDTKRLNPRIQARRERHARPILAGGALAAALAIGVPTAASAQPAASLLYERTLMNTADARCHLFTPQIASALRAAMEQARGAALRTRASAAEVDGAQARARAKAMSVACNNPDLELAAIRVRQAFNGYARLIRMTFRGVFSEWRAERPHPARKEARWSLLQFAAEPDGSILRGSHLMIGLAGLPGRMQLTVLSDDPRAATASVARISLRDPAKLGEPYADPNRRDLAGHLPAADLTQTFLAGERAPAPAPLLPIGSRAGTVFVFRPLVREAMDQLDPRDTFTIQLVFPSPTGDRVLTGWAEIGDFRAGEAFLAVQTQPAPPRPPRLF
jgi:hypothetical protein